MTRRRTPGDPTARTATTNALELSDTTVLTATVMVELVATVEMSDLQVHRWAGMSRRELYEEYTRRTSEARRPSSAVSSELHALVDGLPPEIKAAVRATDRSMLRPCEQCEQSVVPPPTRAGGRPQRFCSNACRQKAYRQRSRGRSAD
ncbi:hypothetical protein PUR61_05330 [Streptomyces sp. BE20]|uniref:hypothetical protein n=1 Tax=Streptomyces sp. BE20 TaxID=3002525 RepID=UPI002E766EB3|nr:hypothetical protein [Streptomyces sp. BE20]MEE1821620.1 hypothetical protein [Streptomyces sp. BE20]